MAPRKPRCLLIWQDNLLGEAEQVVVDYLGTGITITPFGKADRPGLKQCGRVLLYGLRLLFRRYDRVIIPAIDFTWKWDASPWRGRFRRALARLLSLKPDGRTPLLRWFVSRRGLLCVLDRYDVDVILEDYAKLVGADLYLKTNLSRARQAAGGASSMKLDVLPYWVVSECYPEPRVEKDVDLFYSVSLNSDARRLASTEVAQLQKDGLRVVVSSGQLSLGEYLALLQRSHLTLSPEGYGYHCFRHYEAMLCGSVPVINLARQDYITDLRDQENCLMYDPTRQGELSRVVKAALRNKPHLSDWGRRLRQFALDHHSMKAVGSYILQTLAISPNQPA